MTLKEKQARQTMVNNAVNMAINLERVRNSHKDKLMIVTKERALARLKSLMTVEELRDYKERIK